MAPTCVRGGGQFTLHDNVVFCPGSTASHHRYYRATTTRSFITIQSRIGFYVIARNPVYRIRLGVVTAVYIRSFNKHSYYHNDVTSYEG